LGLHGIAGEIRRTNKSGYTCVMTITEYRQICQKGDFENYLLDRFVFRKISIYGTVVCARLGLSPNLVTLISLLCAIGSLYPLGTNSPTMVGLGCALVFIYNFLDHVDGELARFYIHTGGMRPGLTGQYFDVLCHSYSANLMLLFMAWAAYQEHGNILVLFIGVAAMAGVNGFPNLVAAKVMMIKIANDPSVLNQPNANEVMFELEKKKKQVSELAAPTFSARKMMKIGMEFFGYPGILFIIVAASLIDLGFAGAKLEKITIDARTGALALVACIHLTYLVVRSLQWMRMFRTIGQPSA
jgi:hypothetical protein